MSAEELAAQADVTRGTVTKIEAGGANPTVQTLGAIAGVFGLTAGDLLRMAEGGKIEKPETVEFDHKGYSGVRHQFSGFEMYCIKAPAGVEKHAEPEFHENTYEVCFLLSGEIAVNAGSSREVLKPGAAVRFNALQEHWFEVIKDSEFILIHHPII